MPFAELPKATTFPAVKQDRNHPVVHVEYPDWVDSVVDWRRVYRTDSERMSLAIAVSRENVERGTGGPFGAAIFDQLSGKLVSVGMNSVVRHNNCALHAEIVAFMLAQQRVGSFTLNAPGLPAKKTIRLSPSTLETSPSGRRSDVPTGTSCSSVKAVSVTGNWFSTIVIWNPQ